MAREASLWVRCKTGIKHLARCGHRTHFCRLENAAGEGNPDVEGVINGDQCWIELKSCDRPKRETTPIRPRTRESQSIWHRERTKADSRIHWVLIQVGSGHKSKLYLIPGSFYDELHVPEADLECLSVVAPDETVASILLRACEGW